MKPMRNFGAMAILGAITLAACGADSATQPADVKFETVPMKIKDKEFTIEVADTDEKRQQGLMHREKMPADHGMIFVFDKPDYHGFWMKNTKIPLDLVYLDAAGKVIDIFPLKPHDETPVSPRDPASYALELNAGTCKELGLAVGDTVAIPAKIVKKQ